MNKCLFLLCVLLFLLSCGDSREPSSISQQDNDVSHIDTTEELSINSAYQKFSGAFTDNNVKIDTAVLNMLFPNEVFTKTHSFILPMVKLSPHRHFEAYVFHANFSVYLCVFSVKNEPHLKQIEELYPTGIRDIEFNSFFGSRSVAVYMKPISKKNAVYDLWIIDDNGDLIKISNISNEQLPPLIDEKYFFTNFEDLLGNRYYVMEHATDVVGSLYVYDLKTKSYLAKYQTIDIPKYNNDTLYLLERGECLGNDSLGLCEYEKIELKLVNAKLVERNVIGYFISH